MRNRMLSTALFISLAAGGLSLAGCPDWFAKKKQQAGESAKDSLFKAGQRFADEAKRATGQDDDEDR